jgi:hypothetical protein
MNLYFKIRGRVFGPFPEQESLEMVRQGKVSRTNEVSEDGIHWVYAGDMELLFPKQTSSQFSEEASAKLYDHNESSPNRPLPSPPPHQSIGMPSWYFQDSGVSVGPIPEEQIPSLILMQRILPSTLVWMEGMPSWCFASQTHLSRYFILGVPAAPHGSMIPRPMPRQRSATSGKASTQKSGSGATASLILGLFGIVAWLLPLVGFPVTLAGIICGIRGLSGSNKVMATFGLVLSFIFFTLTIINAAIGGYQGYTGQHPLFR